MAELTFIGAAHVDETARLQAPAVPAASNPVRWHRSVGGVAANAARAAAATGATVRLAAAIGADGDGAQVRNTLKQAGVALTPLRVPSAATGRYTLVLEPNGELHIGLADTAIAEAVTRDQVATLAQMAQASDLVIVDANLSTEALAAAAALGPIAALPVSPAKAVRLYPIAPQITLLIANRREAAALTGKNLDTPLPELADHLQQQGFTQLVLTDGPAPLLIDDGMTRQSLTPPAPTGPLQTVNGAGDALAGATLAAHGRGMELAAAVQQAGFPAALNILEGRATAPILAADSQGDPA